MNELFTPQSVGTGAFNTDPCAGAAATLAFSAAQCANTGVSAAQYGHITPNSANQYNGLTGGNPDLQPEIANTYSAGIVLTPRYLRNFSITADYFNIFISGVISAVDPQTTINTCAETGNPTLCQLIHRAPTTGSLFLGTAGYVTETTANLGSLQTSGIDVSSDYRVRIPDFYVVHNAGNLAFNVVATYLNSLTTENLPGSGSKYNCSGFYGPVCGTPNPKIRGEFRATWETPVNLLLSAHVRYVDSVKTDGENFSAAGGSVLTADRSLPSRTYLDLTASYKIKNYNFRVGVNNVLDRDPPIIGSTELPAVFGNGNTIPGLYDVLGRTLFASLTADF